MLLATIEITINEPEDVRLPPVEIDAVIAAIDGIDWDTLAENALREAGIGETLLDRLIFDEGTWEPIQ